MAAVKSHQPNEIMFTGVMRMRKRFSDGVRHDYKCCSALDRAALWVEKTSVGAIITTLSACNCECFVGLFYSCLYKRNDLTAVMGGLGVRSRAYIPAWLRHPGKKALDSPPPYTEDKVLS